MRFGGSGGRKVVILGTAPRAFEHPPDAEVWVVNGPYMPPRWDRLFQLHGRDHIQAKHGWEFIAQLRLIKQPRRLYMTSTYSDIPAAERLDIEAIKASAGDYLTSSFPILIAFAVMEGARAITLDGVMWSGGPAQWGAGEGWAVPCVEYHLGRAAALGVELKYPAGCGLFAHREFVYGFEGPGSV